MKKTLVKLVLAFLVSTVISLPLFSAEAKVTYVKGKVEVSHNGSDWVPLKTGDVIAQSDTINTGFQSEARINLNGSIMAVPALTRVTIETLQTSGSKDTVSLYVNTGAVRSKVTHTDNKKIDYTARTAVAVASVRGTDYTVTAGGIVTCDEGAVVVTAAKDYVAPVVTEDSSEDKKEEGEEESGSEGETGSSGSTDTTGTKDSTETTDSTATTESTGTTETASTTNASEKTATNTGNTDRNNKSANATTEGKDISSTSTDGSIVVGAGQRTKATSIGKYEKSTSQTADKTDKIKNTGNTQAQKDAVNNTSTKAEQIPVDVPIPTTGTVVVNIVIQD